MEVCIEPRSIQSAQPVVFSGIVGVGSSPGDQRVLGTGGIPSRSFRGLRGDRPKRASLEVNDQAVREVQTFMWVSKRATQNVRVTELVV